VDQVFNCYIVYELLSIILFFSDKLQLCTSTPWFNLFNNLWNLNFRCHSRKEQLFASLFILIGFMKKKKERCWIIWSIERSNHKPRLLKSIIIWSLEWLPDTTVASLRRFPFLIKQMLVTFVHEQILHIMFIKVTFSRNKITIHFIYKKYISAHRTLPNPFLSFPFAQCYSVKCHLFHMKKFQENYKLLKSFVRSKVDDFG